jgi:predicted DNA-binding transcriptional regulator AlpA
MEWDMSSKSYAAPSAFQHSGHEQEPVTVRSPMERPERLIGFQEVHDRVGLSRSSIWRLERAGHFPPSVRISPGRRAWREADVDRWISLKLGASAP